MKMQREFRKLTRKMNFINSLGPHTGSSSFPMKRRPIVLITTFKKWSKTNLNCEILFKAREA